MLDLGESVENHRLLKHIIEDLNENPQIHPNPMVWTLISQDFPHEKDHFPLFVAGDHKASPGSQVHVLAEFQNEAGVNLVDD